MKRWLIFLCLVIFHAPDGSMLSVESAHIAAVRPVSDSVKEHLAPNSKAIVYVGAHKFAITETAEQAEAMIEGCESN